MVLVICFWKEWFYMGFSGCFVRCCRFPFCSWFVFRVLRTQNSTWHWRSSSHSCVSYIPLRGLPWAYVLISRSMDVPKRSRIWIHCGRIHTPGNFDMEPKVGEHPGKTHSRRTFTKNGVVNMGETSKNILRTDTGFPININYFWWKKIGGLC